MSNPSDGGSDKKVKCSRTGCKRTTTMWAGYARNTSRSLCDSWKHLGLKSRKGGCHER
jgi:hypothetical protein